MTGWLPEMEDYRGPIAAQGVRLINLDTKDRVSSVAKAREESE
jgi:hypothetical protein